MMNFKNICTLYDNNLLSNFEKFARKILRNSEKLPHIITLRTEQIGGYKRETAFNQLSAGTNIYVGWTQNVFQQVLDQVIC